MIDPQHLTLHVPPAGRVLVVGDVHGCSAELARLLEAAELGMEDRVLFVGDLVNNGPDTHGVVKMARKLDALSVVGNHEWRLLRARALRKPRLLKESDHTTLRQLRPRDWAYLETMALTVELPQFETVVVHGGFLPDQPWRSQAISVVTRIQVVTADGRAAKRSKSRAGTPWASLWKGPPFVIYGHTPRPAVAKSSFALGIDTGCVYGGSLTGVLLPERRIIRIPAAQRYCK